MNTNILLVAIVCVAVSGVNTSDQANGLKDAMKKPKATAKTDFLSGRNAFRRTVRSDFDDDASRALNNARAAIKNMHNHHASVAVDTLLNHRKDFSRLLPEFKPGSDSLLETLKDIEIEKQNEILKILQQELLSEKLAENERLDREYAERMGYA